MSNNEFDKILQRVVDDETIPFNDANWQRMQAMMDDRKDTKKLLILPIIYQSHAAAAAVLFAVVGILSYYTSQQSSIVVKKNSTFRQAIPSTPPAIITDDTVVAPNTYTSSVTTSKQAKQIDKKITPKTAINQEIENNIAVTNDEATHTPTTTIKPEKKYEHLPLYMPYQEQPKTAGAVFGINTGMAVHQANSGFAAGVTIKNKITNRISIQTGLGFVQGRQNVSVKHTNITEEPIVIISDTSQTMGIQRTVTESYEQYSRNLPYVQFNPGVSFKLTKKIHIVAGADIQRIITDDATLRGMNEHLATIGKKIPKTDVGTTISLSYLITKNIGAGVSYRNSLAGKADDNTEYIKRNYFLFQMQYIFNRQ
ncbi:hypothetical protein CAP35_14470 [Chitinophagaceae bacterium IBVUCB1]|nr:hypothetical protein CAP35_14470 [Chitinophagaceae bacterium IBVUCB1]